MLARNKCTSEVDIRFPPPYTPTSLIHQVEEHLRRIRRRLPSAGSRRCRECTDRPNAEHVLILREVAQAETTVLVHALEAVYYTQVNPRVVIFGAGDVQLRRAPRCRPRR